MSREKTDPIRREGLRRGKKSARAVVVFSRRGEIVRFSPRRGEGPRGGRACRGEEGAARAEGAGRRNHATRDDGARRGLGRRAPGSARGDRPPFPAAHTRGGARTWTTRNLSKPGQRFASRMSSTVFALAPAATASSVRGTMVAGTRVRGANERASSSARPPGRGGRRCAFWAENIQNSRRQGRRPRSRSNPATSSRVRGFPVRLARRRPRPLDHVRASAPRRGSRRSSRVRTLLRRRPRRLAPRRRGRSRVRRCASPTVPRDVPRCPARAPIAPRPPRPASTSVR